MEMSLSVSDDVVLYTADIDPVLTVPRRSR